MTVINTTNKVRETGNNSNTEFSFSFKIFNTTDLEVSKIDTSVTPEVVTLQVEGVDYTVSINTSSEGGDVNYTVAPTATEDSFIKRIMPRTQTTDIPRESNFPELAIENEFDKSRMIDIEEGEVGSRTVKLAETSTLTDIVFPEPGATV